MVILRELLHGRLSGNPFVFADFRQSHLQESLRRPNRLTTSYAYDNLGRLERVIHEDSQGQILERFDYTYDVDTIDGTGNPVYKGLRTKRMGERPEGPGRSGRGTGRGTGKD